MGYYGQKGPFLPFLAKMAIFGHFFRKQPGSYRAKNRPKPQKWGIFSKTG